MNDKKLYMVTADIYDDSYGSMISFFGVFDDLDKAGLESERLEKEYNYFTQISEVTLNKTQEIYLGGYYE